MEDIKKIYPSASVQVPCFHVSTDDAYKIFKDKDRFNCPDCFDIYKQSRGHCGRVVISNHETEGLHLIGLSNL